METINYQLVITTVLVVMVMIRLHFQVKPLQERYYIEKHLLILNGMQVQVDLGRVFPSILLF